MPKPANPLSDLLDGLDLSPAKRAILELNHEYLMPNRVETWAGVGVPLVIGMREGYRIWDVDGKELQDLHLNGGTYNLGHRHPDLVRALVDATESLDVGNHHFPSEARGKLAKRLFEITPGDLHYSVLTPSGSEAIDVAIKSARRATGRRKIVSIDSGFHGTSGLSGAAGDDSGAAYFASDSPDEFAKIPYNDLPSVYEALRHEDVAAFLIETIPATFGFPIPDHNYLPNLAELCQQYGTLLIADEVQTGLGRSGHLWAVDAYGVEPDILVTGKGLGGGLYPMGAAVLSREVGQWLHERGWGYVSTFGGSELGCTVALAALDIYTNQATLETVQANATFLASGLAQLAADHPFLFDVRQEGLIVGLGFDGPNAGVRMSMALYQAGLWAMFAGFDRRYVQWKLGLLVDQSYIEQALERLESALIAASAE